MQIFGLQRHIYKLARYARTQQSYKEEAQKRLKILGDWELLKKRGVPDLEIARITGISRSSYYRRKKAIKIYGLSGIERRSTRPRHLRQSKIPDTTITLILKLRLENPTYGKAKITVLLQRDHGTTLSESSVGRILKKLMADQKITHYPFEAVLRKKRTFKGHAKRLRYGMKAARPGELVQIDHMTVSKNGKSFKHFQAWDPITKIIIADITTNATSSAAAQFLEKVQEQLPFKMNSIQVDGGSEFMRHFETACASISLSLFFPQNVPSGMGASNAETEPSERIFMPEKMFSQTLSQSSKKSSNPLFISTIPTDHIKP